MTDRKNTNKYYPPDYDPRKGSLNTQLGQHVLRKRANKVGEGILVVRFELPFNAWCLSCGCHIGKGVRYNADKQQVSAIEGSSLPSPKGSAEPVVITPEMSRQGWKSVGGMLMYHTTKVWQFSMTCARCSGKIVIRTDPQISNYVMHSGIRAQSDLSTSTDHDAPRLLDDDDRARMKTDALFALEHGEADKAKATENQDRLRKLYEMRETRSADDFSVNQAVRRIHRGLKKQAASALSAGASRGLPFALAPPTPAEGEEREQEEREITGWKRRRDEEDRAKERERTVKQARRTVAAMHSSSATREATSSPAAASSSASASTFVASAASSVALPAAAASSSSRSAASSAFRPSFIPSSSLPLALVQPKKRPQQKVERTARQPEEGVTVTKDHLSAAASDSSLTSAALASSSALMGLGAYASEEED